MHWDTHPYEYVYIARLVQSNRLHISRSVCRPGLQVGPVRARQGYKFKFTTSRCQSVQGPQVLARVRAIPKTTQVPSMLTDSGVQWLSALSERSSAPPFSAFAGIQVTNHSLRRHATYNVHVVGRRNSQAGDSGLPLICARYSSLQLRPLNGL